MARLTVSNDDATITRVSSRTRAGEDKVPLVAITIEIPEASLQDEDIGRLFRARGRPLTLSIQDPQLEMAGFGGPTIPNGRAGRRHEPES